MELSINSTLKHRQQVVGAALVLVHHHQSINFCSQRSGHVKAQFNHFFSSHTKNPQKEKPPAAPEHPSPGTCLRQDGRETTTKTGAPVSRRQEEKTASLAPDEGNQQVADRAQKPLKAASLGRRAGGQRHQLNNARPLLGNNGSSYTTIARRGRHANLFEFHWAGRVACSALRRSRISELCIDRLNITTSRVGCADRWRQGCPAHRSGYAAVKPTTPLTRVSGITASGFFVSISDPLPCLADISFTVNGAALFCRHPALLCRHPALRNQRHASGYGDGRRGFGNSDSLEFRPDVHPVTRPKVLPSHGAGGSSLNGRARLHRQAALSIPPKDNGLGGHPQNYCQFGNTAHKRNGALNLIHTAILHT